MDTIDRARQAMKAAENDYLDALDPIPGGGRATDDELADLEEDLEDAREAYRRACLDAEPTDCSGVYDGAGHVYSDADPGL